MTRLGLKPMLVGILLLELVAVYTVTQPQLSGASGVRVQMNFEPTYRYQDTWSLPPRSLAFDPGVVPLDLALLKDGRTLVVDDKNNVIVVYGTDGLVQEVWRDRPTSAFCGGNTATVPMAIDATDHWVYVLWNVYLLGRSPTLAASFFQTRTLNGTIVRTDELPTRVTDMAVYSNGGESKDGGAGVAFSSSTTITSSPYDLGRGLWNVRTGSTDGDRDGAGTVAIAKSGLIAVAKNSGMVYLYDITGPVATDHGRLALGSNLAEAITADEDGRLYVRVRPPTSGARSAPWLLAFDQQDRVAESFSSQQLGVLADLIPNWSAALDVQGSGVGFVAATGQYRVQRVTFEGQSSAPIQGGLVSPSFEPQSVYDSETICAKSALAMTTKTEQTSLS